MITSVRFRNVIRHLFNKSKKEKEAMQMEGSKMAALSSTATLCICRKTWFSRNPYTFPKQSISFPTNKRSLCVSNSGEANASSTQTESTDVESQNAIEAPQGAPSLISALNVQRALRGIAITDVDHYGRLGLQRGCSYDQVTDAYRKKIEEVLNGGLEEEEEVKKEIELLNESHSILSSIEERRMYDWSLARSEAPDRYVWPFQVDITQAPTQPPPPQEPEDVGPTRLVGYFTLGWLLLAFTLSIVLNR